MDVLKEKLKKLLGVVNYENSLQKMTCEVIYQGNKDVLVIMPNESDKTLCLTLPNIAKKAQFTIIIAPKAYAKNQINYLRSKNITAFYWNGCSSRIVKTIIKNKMAENKPAFKILYVTQQQLFTSHFQFKLSQVKQNISKFIIVDCLNFKSKSFKDDCYKFRKLKANIPRIPFIVFTSTATDLERRKLVKLLQLDNPRILDEALLASPIVCNMKKEIREDILINEIDVNSILKQIKDLIYNESCKNQEILNNSELSNSELMCKHTNIVRLMKIDENNEDMKIVSGIECLMCNNNIGQTNDILEKLKKLLYNVKY